MAIPHQAPDSSVLGYLQAREPAGGLTGQIGPAQSLEDYLQQFVAGVAGLDGSLTRPRWQPEPPNIPDWGVNWASIGIIKQDAIGIYGATIRHPAGDGYDEMQRHEEMQLLISFYGPLCDRYASNLHDGLMIWQNKSELRLVGMAFVEISGATHAPELIKQRWWDRTDKTLTLRRIIRRTYPVLNILSAKALIHTDEVHDYTTSVQAGPAPYPMPHTIIGP